MIEENNTEILDDELIRLVSSSADTSSQYVIFTNADNELFAINVAKVEELIMNKEIVITKNPERHCGVLGVSKIRDNMVTMVNFDEWLGTENYNEADLKLVILANYSNKRIGIIIKSVVGIQSFESHKFYNHSEQDEKTINIVELVVAGKKQLCKIFDSDKLIMDVFPNLQEKEEAKVETIDTANEAKRVTKLILFAEDSILIQKSVRKLFDKLQYKYEVYENGKLLLDRLLSLNPDDVSIIITDIEMPVMDGMVLLTELKNRPQYHKIPIIVNTNMANNAVVSNALALGAHEVVKKLDLESLHHTILKYAL